MTQDLLTQLGEYGSYSEGLQGPVTADEVIDDAITTVVPLGVTVRPTQPRRPWLIGLAAAAAVAVLVGGAAWLLPVAETDTPELIAQPTVPSSPSGWSRVVHDEAGFGGAVMSSVTTGGPGLVAVGTANSGSPVWISVDGLTWSRVPDDDMVFGGAKMNSVTAGGPGLVAVGTANSSASVWTSVDGIVWSKAPDDGAVLGGAVMSAVTVGGPGLVAVGWEGSESDGNAAVWISSDGITWSRVLHDESVFGGDGIQQMTSVTAGGPGLVAVGWRQYSGAESSTVAAAVWTSRDGVTWSAVPHDDVVFGAIPTQVGETKMSSVTAGGPGLVAVGWRKYDSAVGAVVVWTSHDGITWAQAPHDQTAFGSGSTMAGVSATRQGLVGVGSSQPSLVHDGDAAVWTSPDGLTWSRIVHDESVFGGAEMSSVTFAGPGLVAVGGDRSAEPGDAYSAVAWIAATED